MAFASLGIARSQQLHQQDQLNEELSVAERRLDKFQLKELYLQKENLEVQLNQTISQVEAAKAMLSQPSGSIDISDTVFSIAEACGVEVTEISSADPARDDLKGVTCSVLPLTTSVEGDVPNLIYFITRLNNDFSTGVVKSAEINIPEAADGDRPSASIRLVVYSYQGR